MIHIFDFVMLLVFIVREGYPGLRGEKGLPGIPGKVGRQGKIR